MNPHGHGRASDWIERFLPGVVPGGAVIDVACGAGRHLRRALSLGHPGVGIDRDPSGLSDLAGRADVEIFGHDLEREGGLVLPTGDRRFAGVIVTNYLFRPLFPLLRAMVAADGMLLYQTFSEGQERHGKPSNPAFLLKSNELLSPTLIDGLVVVAFEQGEVPSRHGTTPKVVQRICAVGPAHPWAAVDPRPLGAP
ncbi:MAG: class I SAM-dependent methyltransferase [Phyllobacteriaceae bacterium]|nr:class I SAM-dependent methyltransferase [Phyllobacteriaceae bacterium]